MSNRIQEMTDEELVDHYRDMQHLPVDTDTVDGIKSLAYYQAIVREIAHRFAIQVENKEVEDDQTDSCYPGI